LRNIIVSRFADILGESSIPALDLVSNYDELGAFITAKIRPEFQNYGLELTKLLVENISLPKDVEEAIDKRSSMGAVGNLNAFTQFQAATAIEDAANNPGSAGGAMGMGMGMMMGGQMGGQMGSQTAQAAASQPAAAVPPPLPQPAQFFIAVNGQQAGPFGLDALGAQATGGQLTRETLVWQAGMAAWAPAGDVATLASLFAQTPPPLPPQAP
jgi:membrane protease subunit (stomatin/prohibitin family)